MQSEELAVEIEDFSVACKSTLLSPFYAEQPESSSPSEQPSGVVKGDDSFIRRCTTEESAFDHVQLKVADPCFTKIFK